MLIKLGGIEVSQPHYFIGIPVSKDVNSFLKGIQDECKSLFPYRIWTHPSDYHITLKFLGAVEERKLSNLKDKLKKVDGAPFHVNIGGLSSFGDPKQPRVLWAGVDGSDALEKLQKDIEEQCAYVDFPVEKRPFRPHITLAKKWTGEEFSEDTIRTFFKHKIEKELLHVHSFSLFRIHPKEEPKYEQVMQFTLNKGKLR